MTHDYKRNGTTDLFAALNVGTGEVLTDSLKSHTAADVLRFFKLIDLHVPRNLDVHVVLDNLSDHKAPEVQKWLAHPKRTGARRSLPTHGKREDVLCLARLSTSRPARRFFGRSRFMPTSGVHS